MKKQIFDYFNNHVEYPEYMSHDVLPYGEIWHYISDIFLNAFINEVEPLCIFVADRHCSDNELLKVTYRLENHGDWIEDNVTKNSLKQMIGDKRFYFGHTKLSVFKDDIIILARIKHDAQDSLNRYMFFYFDCDVSDCSIGRFETSDDAKTVISAVESWLYSIKINNAGRIIQTNYDPGIIGYTQIPLSFLTGFITF